MHGLTWALSLILQNELDEKSKTVATLEGQLSLARIEFEKVNQV